MYTICKTSCSYLSGDGAVQCPGELDAGLGQVLRQALVQVNAQKKKCDRVWVGDINRLVMQTQVMQHDQC